jgi:hypothetical protein
MTEIPSGWVRVTGASLWRLIWSAPTRPAGINFLLVLVGVQLVIQFGLRVVQFELGDTAYLIALVAFALAIVAAFVFAASRSQTPSINFDESLIRVGRRTYRFDEVTNAAFLTLPHRKGTSSYLLFGRGALAAHALVCVRSSREPEIGERDRELVAEVLRRASIVIPESKPDPYDPTGRFAWMDRPNSLTRDEAVEYVLHTPADGQPVRSAPPKKSIWIDGD